MNYIKNEIYILLKKTYHLLKKLIFLIYKSSKFYEKQLQMSFYDSIKFKRLKKTEITEKRICYKKKSSTTQFSNLLSMINIKIDNKKRFQHWIDTGLYYSHKYPLNGECPPNYSLIINNSINDLLKNYSKKDNRTIKNNYKILKSVKKYIYRIINSIDSEISLSPSKSLYNAKNYFTKMLDKKAETLEESFQRILFWSSIFWQTGHSLVGLGRLDKILGDLDNPYDKKETKSMILEFYTILHQYYGLKSNDLLGDTGQLIILGGKEVDGSYFCNYLTYLFIECLIDFNNPDPKILLRVANNIPEDLLELAIACVSTGIGSPLLSNDERVIPSLIKFGYTNEDAYNYVTSACWEPFAYGKSIGNHNLAHLNLAKCFTDIIEMDTFTKIKTFEELVEIFNKNIIFETQKILRCLENIKWEKNPLMTLFTDGCIEKNKDISQGGAIHSDYGFLMVGLANAIDSIYNIKKFVFDEQKYSLFDIKTILMNDYLNYDDVRDIFYNESYFGHDNTEYISFINDITALISDELKGKINPIGGKYCFGLSSFAYMSAGKNVIAMPDGRMASQPLSVHISGKNGLPYTELVNFACQINYNNFIHNGNLLDIMISPKFIINNFEKFILFLKIAIKNGFYQMQMNVVSSDILINAKNNPDLFKNLIVRVWGFSAFFNDLSDEYKDLLIKRAQESERT